MTAQSFLKVKVETIFAVVTRKRRRARGFPRAPDFLDLAGRTGETPATYQVLETPMPKVRGSV